MSLQVPDSAGQATDSLPRPGEESGPGAGPQPEPLPRPSAEPPAKVRPRGRLRALDGLRLVAALMVAFYHYAGQDGIVAGSWGRTPRDIWPQASSMFNYGCLGVELFFVISGFVICMSGWGRTVKDFTISRITRLYPAYWAALIISTVVYVLADYQRIPNTDLLVNFSMFQMPLGAHRVLGVCWTLWAEMRFYILFALVVVWPGASRKRVLLFCGLWMLAAVYADSSSASSFIKVALMPEYAPYFIGGMGLYLIYRFGHDAVSWGVVIAAFLIGQRYAVAANTVGRHVHVFHHRTPMGVTLVVFLSFVAVAAVTLVPRIAAVNWRWLTTAGILTYPFYLIHEHVGWVTIDQFVHHTSLPDNVILPLTILVMLGVAWLVHLSVERTLAPRLKRVLNRSLTAAAATAESGVRH
ncbi:acyltransferase family protein [Streptomyces sp. NBC_01198]|uniref:acyltransferase family protein n=1 Tax=Streptomyces sp. NBC_01198 TaxID=2903769 RepID=UPI002E13B82F|nr:acyltransferase [Streptomyces sp. NBC_01198]